MNESTVPPLPTPTPPTAVLRSNSTQGAERLKTRLWWLAGLSILLTIGLLISNFRQQGTIIRIQFKDGHGLKASDTLRYRGVDLGQVTKVGLSSDLGGVQVEIQLEPNNNQVAVKGSQFWIQRARLSLGNVSGLDTVLGAKYVGVIPGHGAAHHDFVGIENPLAMTEGEGTEIRIRFPAGEGLDIGNPVRHRGIKVGEVVDLQFSDDLQTVEVLVRLVGHAKQLAREGTQFWIERPRIDLTEVRGLDTLLAGNYVALQPSTNHSPPVWQFDGLPEPPPLPRRDGSLEIELDAAQRFGIVRGAPILYRGLEVGKVARIGLSKDGASVRIAVVVDADYAELVRANSKWWAVGGIEFSAALSGISVSVESLDSWIRGGIALATPERDAGPPVANGYRFILEPKSQEQWLSWQPRIALGSQKRSSSGLAHPIAHSVTATWKSTFLGIPRRHSEKSWGLSLDDGTLAVPASFARSAAQASSTVQANSEVRIEVAGVSFPWSNELAADCGEITLIKLPPETNEIALECWSRQQIAQHWNPETVMQIINPELSEPMAIDGSRVEKTGNSLKIAPGFGIPRSLQGSPVVDADSGHVIGILAETQAGWVIGLLD